ncbi:MAG: hypothetical protein GY811_01205 [Myxococcales bacterium]|nr:hypothetical protein [Myxococcales bacterium]
MRNVVLLSFLGLALASTGCLSSSHRIGKGELMNLSRTAPEQRGEKVRVVQGLGHTEGPPRADRVNNNTVVVVHSPIWIDGRPHHHGHHHSGSATSSTSTGGGTVGGSGGSFHGSSGTSILAKSKKDSAKDLIILAAAAAVGLAATEGSRYDGWVKLHPMHPVHLYGPYGGYTVLPLAHIDERTAAWADHAYVRSGEGPFTHLGRAPLNRKGFTYSVLLGGGQIPALGVDEADPLTGFNGHIQFGYFPTKRIGLQWDIGMGWAADDTGETVFISRNALELDAYLAKAGPIHAGLFGQIGFASRYDDGVQFDDNSNLLGGGALLQLDITTRLALTGRAGVTRSFGEGASEASLGISIY